MESKGKQEHGRNIKKVEGKVIADVEAGDLEWVFGCIIVDGMFDLLHAEHLQLSF